MSIKTGRPIGRPVFPLFLHFCCTLWEKMIKLEHLFPLGNIERNVNEMKRKKFLSLVLAGAMSLSLAAPAMAEEKPEGWIPADGARPAGEMVKPIEGENSTYIPTVEEAQSYVTEKGWMTGTDKGFEPELTVDRATMYEMFWKMEGKPVAETGHLLGLVLAGEIPDGAWYSGSARWAYQSGLTTGTGNGFEGERVITKAEGLEILYRYMKDYKAMDVSVEEWSLEVFEDYDQIQDWAKESVTWGWLSGVACQRDDDSTLDPAAPVKRAELAQMLTVMGGLMEEQTASAKLGPCVVTAISKYGNVGTDLSMDALTAAGYAVGDILTVEITGQQPITLPLGTGYSNVDQGSPLALADTSNNTLALAINRGDFATTYGLGVKGEDGAYAITEGVTITVAMAEKGGYLAEMEVRELDSKRTNVREDYASDEAFANFRAITLGNIAEGKLYRTSSPVNPELGRNTYADGFLKEAGVKTVVNLADSRETMEGYEGYAESYYASLNVIPLNMGVDMYSEDAKAGLKAGFLFMVENEGPYAFHCTEGKDRAGYFAMVLEALMGATVEEITADYMLSFENYYHVEKGSEQWEKIAVSNIEKDLLKLAGVETAEELAAADLQKAAETYLEEAIGLTAEEVMGLKDALSK